jgi:WD40 repeat protein
MGRSAMQARLAEQQAHVARQQAQLAETEARAARAVTEAKVTESALERGRAAVLHGDLGEARIHLAEAYRHGARGPGISFMLARAFEPRRAELFRLESASGRMWSAAFSPDGKQIVTTDDRSAQVWDADTGNRLLLLPHEGTVFTAAYSADGAWLATAGADGAVKLWEAASGEFVRALTRAGPRLRYYALAISGDRRLVAAVTTTGEIADIWSSRDGALLAELRNPDASDYPALAFSADARWLATGGGGAAHVFETGRWKPVRTIGLRVRSLAFAPSASHLAVGTASGEAAVWTVGGDWGVRRLRDVGESVDRIAWSPDGESVVTASRDGSEQVFDAASGSLRSQGNHLYGRIRSIEFDAASKLVLAAGAGGTVVVADAALGTPLAVLEGPQDAVTSARFDPNARRIVGASLDGTARVWDAAPSYRRWSSPPVADECGVASSLEPDRRFVAVGCRGHRTQVWDTARDLLLADLPGMSAGQDDFAPALPAVSADGNRVAVARGNAVEIYGLPGGTLLRTVSHGAAVTAVAFAGAGRDLVSGGADGSVLLTRDGSATLALPLAAGGIDAAAILPDRRVVVTDARKRLRVYPPDGNTALTDLSIPARVGLLRPSPDGRLLITVPGQMGESTPPMLWDLERYRLRAALDGHVGRAFSARFVRNGREILTAGGDGTVKSWDAATGRPRATYRGSRHLAVVDATLTPDGAMVVAGGDGGLLRYWDAADARPLWTLHAHKSPVIAVHFEGADVVTRGFGGDISRWTVPQAREIAELSAAPTR